MRRKRYLFVENNIKKLTAHRGYTKKVKGVATTWQIASLQICFYKQKAQMGLNLMTLNDRDRMTKQR